MCNPARLRWAISFLSRNLYMHMGAAAEPGAHRLTPPALVSTHTQARGGLGSTLRYRHIYAVTNLVWASIPYSEFLFANMASFCI